MARILILDDEPKFSTSLQGLLEGLGHEVSLAKSVPDVLESHLEAPPELLICDLVLPGPEPMAAVTALRAKAADLVVIAVSGFFDEGPGVARFMEQSGAAGFLHKPFDFDVLLELLRKSLGHPTDEAQGSREPDLGAQGSLTETSLATVLVRAAAGFGSVVTVSSDRGMSRFFLSQGRLCFWQSNRPGANLPGLLGLTEDQVRPVAKRGRLLGRSLLASLQAAGLTTEPMAKSAWRQGIERLLPPLLVAPGEVEIRESADWLDFVPDLDLDVSELIIKGLRQVDPKTVQNYLGQRIHGLLLPGDRFEELSTVQRRIFPRGLRSKLSKTGILIDELLQPLWSDPRRREEAIAEIYALLVTDQAIVLERASEPDVGIATGMGVIAEREHQHDNLTGLDPETREIREGIREFAMALPTMTHYQVLGVDKTAEKQAIQDGFRAIFVRYHADRLRDVDLGSDQELVAQIQAAAGVARDALIDPDKRKEYDAQIERKASGASSDVEALLATDGTMRRVERLLAESRYKQARRLVDELLEVNPADPRFQIFDQFCAAMGGEMDAEDVYETVKERLEDLVLVGSERMLGELALRLGRDEAAKRHFRAALEQNRSDHAAARNYRRLGGKI
ncbi:MAG TPA: hypothetical protein DEB46_13385 [Myxococcales bacterium]|nr:hypothetical protein [Myxococcales bacterium]HBU49296.1 hypothetical protein [Myxococcales bacterium]